MSIKIYVNPAEDIETQVRVFKRKVSYEGISEVYRSRRYESPKIRKQNKSRKRNNFLRYISKGPSK